MRIATSWRVEDPLASDVDIVRMIQLDSGRLPLPSNKCTWTVDEQAQLVVSRFFTLSYLRCPCHKGILCDRSARDANPRHVRGTRMDRRVLVDEESRRDAREGLLE